MSADGDDAVLRQELKDAQQQLKEWDKELNGLHEKNGDLDLQVQNLESEKRQLQAELLEVRSQLSTQTAPQYPELPDAGTLLNRLKAKHKKSKTDLKDVETILQLAAGKIQETEI